MKKCRILFVAILTLGAVLLHCPQTTFATNPALDAINCQDVRINGSLLNQMLFLMDFKTLAESCEYDDVSDYEKEESVFMGRPRLDSAQVGTMPRYEQERYLELVKSAARRIVHEKKHGLCRHFSTCVADICEEHSVNFNILVIPSMNHSAILYGFKDKLYVADALLQIAYNHKISRFHPFLKKVDEKVITPLRYKSDPEKQLSGVKGIECGMISLEEYLYIIGKNRRDVIVCDENFRPVTGSY